MALGKRLEAGGEIDGFRLEEHLHRGGMASLWRVTRADLPAEGALMKIPSLRDQTDPTAIVGFEVEQMILPRLSGPHVPRFIAAGGFEEQPYIVMELLPGHSLRARFEQAPLPPEEVAAIGVRVATALHDLHRQHVIHLDVKPSNIMFRADGAAVLIDYGLARHDHLPDLLAEEFRLPMGTGPYISPEQVQGIRNDPRSDLFALGVLLYHLATGARPFGNPSSVRGLRQRLHHPPEPPRAHNPQLPPWLQEVILRCLEPDPKRRYASAAQVAGDLKDPAQVALTIRAERLRAPGLPSRMRHWLRSLGAEAGAGDVAQHLDSAAIVLAAVDLSQEWEALAAALRTAVRRVLQTEPGARLACVSVLKVARIGMEETTDEAGRNLHVKRLVELKHWARPLQLAPERVTFHVLKSPDPADAILDYAQINHVDHIVIGNRGLGGLRRYLGSVSAKVVAEAQCTVTVVKPPALAQGRAADAASA
jgi:nucleotide-binding universal stress UspA family protein